MHYFYFDSAMASSSTLDGDQFSHDHQCIKSVSKRGHLSSSSFCSCNRNRRQITPDRPIFPSHHHLFRWQFRYFTLLTSLLILLLLQINLATAADKQYHTQTTVDRRYELQILRRLLAAGYTYYARPLTTDNGTLEVRTRISLIKIQNLWERTDVKTEALEVTMRIQLNWCDGALSWEPDSFGGVDYVIIPGDRLWIPDIQIINALDDVYALIRDRRFDFKLHSDGCVWWFPTGTIFTRCELDLSYFPFDIQRCPIVFESAMYPKEFLNLTVRYDKSAVSLKTFTESGQWDLITAYAVPKLNYVTTSTAFSRVEITLEIRRKTLYYKINVFFPCGMLSALQILTFFLPIGSEDRISQSTTILLSVVVFQSIVVGELPRTSNSIPLLCLYIDFLTGISVLTVADAILGVYVLNYTNRHGCLARFLQCVVLLGRNPHEKAGQAGCKDPQKASKTLIGRSNRRSSIETIGGDGDMEMMSHPNNIVPDKFITSSTITPRRPPAKSTTLVNEEAVMDDAFEEDSLDAMSRHETTNVDLLVVSTPDKSIASNHTIIVNKNRSNNNNNNAANYGTTSSSTASPSVKLPAPIARSSIISSRNQAQAPPQPQPQAQQSQLVEQYRKSLQKRLLDPLFMPNNFAVHNNNRSGGGGGGGADNTSDDDNVSVGTNALRTAAVCIDNIVFLIALTSSILIPFYMFNILPPTS